MGAGQGRRRALRLRQSHRRPDLVDGEYATNRAQAALGLAALTALPLRPAGHDRNDAVLEADHFVDTAQLGRNHLLPVLDLEVNNGLGPKSSWPGQGPGSPRVQQRLGVKAIIYTGAVVLGHAMGNTRWFADNGYRLWIAHYGVSQPTMPAHNWGGRGWTMWQYTNRATVDGVDGNVDLDRYAGTSLAPLRIKNNR